MAYEVAIALLHLPLDVFVVRKLGVPGHEELAMGALASGGVRVLNPNVLEKLLNPEQAIIEATAREKIELERREKRYRGKNAAYELKDKTVILVDDGCDWSHYARSCPSAPPS